MRVWLLVSMIACQQDPQTTPAGGEPLAFLPDAGPVQVDPESVGDDGLILDRLVVRLRADADADDLDAVLAEVGGTVTSARPGVPWITVGIPAVHDLAEAEGIAARLEAVDGVGGARPAWLVVPENPTSGFREAPAPLEANGNAALGDQRFFAAWNATSLAKTRVPVVVVDYFTANRALPQLSGLHFVGPEAPVLQLKNDDGEYDGNHGFWVTSLLGADADGRSPIGTHPAPATTLDITAINALGVGDMVDIMHVMDRHLPSGFFVLNTSLGFNARTPLEARAEAALLWRELIQEHGGSFLHTTSAGNDGLRDPQQSRFNSPFYAQSSVDDLRALLTGDDLDDFADVWEDALERRPALAAVQGHTVVVGASDDVGAEVGFSNRGADVRMLATAATGVCAKKDKTCADTAFGLLLTADGTSAAAPQAAGLAAWLRAIDPTLDAAALRQALIAHYDGRWVDALSATLALESRGKPVRTTWLDQDGDRDFDDADVLALAVALVEGDAAPADAARTWPRADLNGDGRVRSDTRTSVDLDGDGELGVVVVTVPGIEATDDETLELSEFELSDSDILCWAAYGTLFTGDAESRDSLVRTRCQPSPGLITATASASSRVSSYVPTEADCEIDDDDGVTTGQSLETETPLPISLVADQASVTATLEGSNTLRVEGFWDAKTTVSDTCLNGEVYVATSHAYFTVYVTVVPLGDVVFQPLIYDPGTSFQGCDVNQACGRLEDGAVLVGGQSYQLTFEGGGNDSAGSMTFLGQFLPLP
ncbi:MAG: S8 family serine peptidase [Alphaproteobacteria bacterium]|nr:S8 family serine peptidase [Alphaproteobacteria bacterium]MCB9699744.1 S8 family serine peptidase [Alphaproteobacteria bacterium]